MTPSSHKTVYRILTAIALAHLCNDLLQSVVPAMYPLLQQRYQLSMTQIGIITFTFQGTASLLQPVVGYYTDRYPTPYSLVLGMSSSLIGLLLMAFATNYLMVLAAAALIGMGSSVFHPESSRVARLASGGRHGLAQLLEVLALLELTRLRHGSVGRWQRPMQPFVVMHVLPCLPSGLP